MAAPPPPPPPPPSSLPQPMQMKPPETDTAVVTTPTGNEDTQEGTSSSTPTDPTETTDLSPPPTEQLQEQLSEEQVDMDTNNEPVKPDTETSPVLLPTVEDTSNGLMVPSDQPLNIDEETKEEVPNELHVPMEEEEEKQGELDTNNGEGEDVPASTQQESDVVSMGDQVTAESIPPAGEEAQGGVESIGEKTEDMEVGVNEGEELYANQ